MAVPDPERDPQFYDGVPLRRLVAFVIDSVLILLLMWVIGLVGMLVGVLTLGLALPVFAVLFMSAGFFYRWLLIAQQSATIGMAMTGIELRRADGERLDGVTAFLHTGGFYVCLAVFVLMIASIVIMFGSAHRRMLHDLVLGTVMINRPV